MIDKRVCEGPNCDVEFSPAVHNQKYHDQQCKRDSENVSRRRQYTQDVADAVAQTVAPAYLELDDEDQVEYLRSEVARLGRLVDKHKSSKGELIEVTYKAAFDAVASIADPPKITKPNLSQQGAPETAVAVFADWQLGKETPDYSSEVCRERIDVYGDKFLEITNIHRQHHAINEARVWLLGDIVEGEEIFPGQSHLIDSSLYRQVGVNGPEILRDFILKLLPEFETVHVTGIIGNHGSIGGNRRKDYNAETNMDRLLYKIVEHMFDYEPRVTFNIPDGNGERNFYAVDTIGAYRTLLLHGDQFPAPSSTHAYYKKVMGWKDGAIPEEFDDVFMGHYHQVAKMTLGSSILRVAGSPESYNTFAQEVLAVMGRPSQHMQFVHPINGVTGEYTLWLDEV